MIDAALRALSDETLKEEKKYDFLEQNLDLILSYPSFEAGKGSTIIDKILFLNISKEYKKSAIERILKAFPHLRTEKLSEDTLLHLLVQHNVEGMECVCELELFEFSTTQQELLFFAKDSLEVYKAIEYKKIIAEDLLKIDHYGLSTVNYGMHLEVDLIKLFYFIVGKIIQKEYLTIVALVVAAFQTKNNELIEVCIDHIISLDKDIFAYSNSGEIITGLVGYIGNAITSFFEPSEQKEILKFFLEKMKEKYEAVQENVNKLENPKAKEAFNEFLKNYGIFFWLEEFLKVFLKRTDIILLKGLLEFSEEFFLDFHQRTLEDLIASCEDKTLGIVDSSFCLLLDENKDTFTKKQTSPEELSQIRDCILFFCNPDKVWFASLDKMLQFLDLTTKQNIYKKYSENISSVKNLYQDMETISKAIGAGTLRIINKVLSYHKILKGNSDSYGTISNFLNFIIKVRQEENFSQENENLKNLFLEQAENIKMLMNFYQGNKLSSEEMLFFVDHLAVLLDFLKCKDNVKNPFFYVEIVKFIKTVFPQPRKGAHQQDAVLSEKHYVYYLKSLFLLGEYEEFSRKTIELIKCTKSRFLPQLYILYQNYVVSEIIRCLKIDIKENMRSWILYKFCDESNFLLILPYLILLHIPKIEKESLVAICNSVSDALRFLNSLHPTYRGASSYYENLPAMSNKLPEANYQKMKEKNDRLYKEKRNEDISRLLDFARILSFYFSFMSNIQKKIVLPDFLNFKNDEISIFLESFEEGNVEVSYYFSFFKKECFEIILSMFKKLISCAEEMKEKDLSDKILSLFPFKNCMEIELEKIEKFLKEVKNVKNMVLPEEYTSDDLSKEPKKGYKTQARNKLPPKRYDKKNIKNTVGDNKKLGKQKGGVPVSPRKKKETETIKNHPASKLPQMTGNQKQNKKLKQKQKPNVQQSNRRAINSGLEKYRNTGNLQILDKPGIVKELESLSYSCAERKELEKFIIFSRKESCALYFSDTELNSLGISLKKYDALFLNLVQDLQEKKEIIVLVTGKCIYAQIMQGFYGCRDSLLQENDATDIVMILPEGPNPMDSFKSLQEFMCKLEEHGISVKMQGIYGSRKKYFLEIKQEGMATLHAVLIHGDENDRIKEGQIERNLMNFLAHDVRSIDYAFSALYHHPGTGVLIDLVGGIAAIQQRSMKTTHIEDNHILAELTEKSFFALWIGTQDEVTLKGFWDKFLYNPLRILRWIHDALCFRRWAEQEADNQGQGGQDCFEIPEGLKKLFCNSKECLYHINHQSLVEIYSCFVKNFGEEETQAILVSYGFWEVFDERFKAAKKWESQHQDEKAKERDQTSVQALNNSYKGLTLSSPRKDQPTNNQITPNNNDNSSITSNTIYNHK